MLYLKRLGLWLNHPLTSPTRAAEWRLKAAASAPRKRCTSQAPTRAASAEGGSSFFYCFSPITSLACAWRSRSLRTAVMVFSRTSASSTRRLWSRLVSHSGKCASPFFLLDFVFSILCTSWLIFELKKETTKWRGDQPQSSFCFLLLCARDMWLWYIVYIILG